MARVTVEDCMQKVNNRFMLVHLAAKRVIQLRKGAELLVEAPKNKEIVQALREIASGDVSFDSLSKLEKEQLLSKVVEDSSESSQDPAAAEQLTAEGATESKTEADSGEEVPPDEAAEDAVK